MKILALDSSGNVASAAILEDRSLLAEYTVNFKKTHSQTLLPMVDEIVRMTELDLQDIDAIAVANGPGSFTGLRIGSATAKGLGLALNRPIVEVPTIAALACNLFDTPGLICPIMDARRNQVYTGIYRFSEGRLFTIEDQKALGIDELVEKLNDYGESVTFLGDGVPVHEEAIRKGLTAAAAFAPAHLSRQRAGAVAYLGQQYYIEGKYVDAAESTPVYLRMSQAERERKAREQKKAGLDPAKTACPGDAV